VPLEDSRDAAQSWDGPFQTAAAGRATGDRRGTSMCNLYSMTKNRDAVLRSPEPSYLKGYYWLRVSRQVGMLRDCTLLAILTPKEGQPVSESGDNARILHFQNLTDGSDRLETRNQ